MRPLPRRTEDTQDSAAPMRPPALHAPELSTRQPPADDNPSARASLATHMVEMAPCCMLAVDARSGNIVAANRRAREIFGLMRGEAETGLVGRSLEALLAHPGARAAYGRLRGALEAAAEGTPARVEGVRLPGREDETYWTFEMTPLEAGEGEDRLSLITAVETTAEHRERDRLLRANYEAELRAERMEAILDHAGDAVIVRDQDGHILAYNRAALAMATNRSMVEHARARGKRVEPVWSLLHEDGAPVPEVEQPAWRAMLTDGAVVRSDLSLLREEGELTPVTAQATPLRDEAGGVTGVVVALQDITPMKELERQKDEFISVASHELRQPLTVIQGQAQMLKRHLRRLTVGETPAPLSGDALKNLADGVESQTTRLNLLVSDLLDMSRIQAGQLRIDPARGSLLPVVRRAVELQRQSTLDHEIILDERLPAGMREVEGIWDLRRIEQVLMNLLGNAVKYSPDGGRIHVEVGMSQAGATHGRSKGRRTPGGIPMAHVMVRDDGIGIPEDALKHLFERFYRASNTEGIQGTGLGLFICRQLARAHNGDLWAESRGIGHGSAFHLVLPVLGEHE